MLIESKIPSNYFSDEYNKTHDDKIKTYDHDSKIEDFATSIDKPFNKSNVPESLDEYTRSSMGYNESLWDKKHYKSSPIQNHEKVKDVYRHLMNHKLNKAMTVYVGVKHLNLGNEGMVHIPQFISSSLSPEIAHRFVNHESNIHKILKIKLKKGQNGVYVAPFSMTHYEHEVILPPSVLWIDHKPKVYNGRSVDGAKYEVHVHDTEIMKPDDLHTYRNHPEVKRFLEMQDVYK